MIELNPRKWVAELSVILTEQSSIKRILTNAIVNDRSFYKSENIQIGLFFGRVKRFRKFDFYQYLDEQPERKINAKYEEYNFMMNKYYGLIKGIDLEKKEDGRHDLQIMELNNSYKKIWSIVINATFDLQKFHNYYLNPDFVGLGDDGKFLFEKSEWEVNPNDPLNSWNNYKGLMNAYFINVDCSGSRNIVELSNDLALDSKIETLAIRSIIEFETIYYASDKGANLIKSVSIELSKIREEYYRLMKKYKMNHVDNVQDFITFFEVCQYPVWGFSEEFTKAFLNDKGEDEDQGIIDVNFINNFDEVKPERVYQYFKEELVDKKHLSNEKLITYLELAFGKKEVPVECFKFQNVKGKQKVINVFYKYYNEIAPKTHREKRRYVKLLSDYFVGYKESNVYSNFSK